MKINFTKKEYRLLVTMMEIADWIMTAHKEGAQPEALEYQTFRKKILSFADEMGMEGCYKKKGDEYYETREYEENSEQIKFIEQYDEDTFWDQLVSRLTDRDYNRKYGNEKVDINKKIERYTELEDMYANEINQSGILNIYFRKDDGNQNVN